MKKPSAQEQPDKGKKPKAARGVKGKKQEALVLLKHLIYSGAFKPGSLISASRLVSDRKLNYSKTPLREAMDDLAQAGIVRWVGASGAIVEQVSNDDIYEILRFRFAIESAVVQEICFQKDNRIVSHLHTLMEKVNQAMEAADEAAQEAARKKVEPNDQSRQHYYDMDVEFHCELARLAGAKRAEKYIANLMEHFRVFAIERCGTPGKVYEEHKAIVDAIAAFDKSSCSKGLEKARNAVWGHILGTATRWAPDDIVSRLRMRCELEDLK